MMRSYDRFPQFKNRPAAYLRLMLAALSMLTFMRWVPGVRSRLMMEFVMSKQS